MLVLTRKLGEGIAIGDDIKIIVMQIKGKQVRIGIKADPSTVVHREEIYQKIHEENELASTTSSHSLELVRKQFDTCNISQKANHLILKKRKRAKKSDVTDQKS